MLVPGVGRSVSIHPPHQVAILGAFCFSFPQIELMPHDLITQLLRVLAIETKQEKAMVHAEPSELALSGLEAFSFDYVVKWPLSLIINR